MANDNDKSVGELDEEIMKLEEELEKNPTPEKYQRMQELMIISNRKSSKKNKWDVSRINPIN
jgi:hypothetical protein